MTDAELNPVDGLAQLTFLVQAMLERRASAHGMSVVQLRLLGMLRDRTPTMADVARRLDLDKSSATGLVDRAERRGLVERVRTEHDRRSVQVRLTERGRALVAGAEKEFEADVAELLRLLPASDRAALATLMSRLLVAQAATQGVDLLT